MPRFLNTYTGEFVWIPNVGATPYVILSHTWRSTEEGGEQTYDDIVKLQIECPVATPQPWNVKHRPPVNEAFFSNPALSDKIRRACEVARKAGHRLIWIDSCCIDKRSSAELSETINSMYVLYRDANSKWHRRGWTLQELVAPACVVFLTRDWTFLGTKSGLAWTLQEITKIDAEILLALKPVSSASVAKRMSWAAGRETTRVEDRAYSLLGIFGVHMSPIYGEGTNAFLRLQEEIIKHVPDQSIFAWGRNLTLPGPKPVPPPTVPPGKLSDPGLLAPSPDAFEGFEDVSPITAFEFARLMGRPRNTVMPPLHCVFTPQGAQIELINMPFLSNLKRPARTLRHLPEIICPDCQNMMDNSPSRSLTFLRCTDANGNLIALPLHCAEEKVEVAENVAIGGGPSCGKRGHIFPRVVRLSAAVLDDLGVTPACVKLFILRHSQAPFEPKAQRGGFSKDQHYHPLWDLYGRNIEPDISLAPNCEEELDAVGFALTPPHLQWREALEQDPTSRELILTTTLNTNSLEEPTPDDHYMHIPSIAIELVIQSGERDQPVVHFSIDRHRKSSTFESTHPSSTAPYGLSTGHLQDDNLGCTPVTPDDGRRRSISLPIPRWSFSHMLAEAEFQIHDCTVNPAGVDGSKLDFVRLLRLKLERSMEDAYVEDCSFDLVFSVELSQPFISNTIPKKTGSACTPTSSTTSQQLPDAPLTQADTEPAVMQDDPSPVPGDALRPRHDAMHASSEPTMPPITTSEYMGINEEYPRPGTASDVPLTEPRLSHCIPTTSAGPDHSAPESSNTPFPDPGGSRRHGRASSVYLACLRLLRRAPQRSLLQRGENPPLSERPP
ncbi:hypothetical protein C2E23DRAFT_39825 [Lenzites betulinus]|nr:hypothetical protein C2E23DRAFT_39825 [Lenzites betulinus]